MPQLDAHRLEVKTMLLTEYDEKLTMELFKKEAREEGREEGLTEGEEKGQARMSALISKLLANGRMDDIARATSDRAALERLFQEYGIT